MMEVMVPRSTVGDKMESMGPLSNNSVSKGGLIVSKAVSRVEIEDCTS